MAEEIKLDSIEDAIQDIADGKVIIVVDDEDREKDKKRKKKKKD
jgi:3,4-dihydroxy 2-butanone 4-phosphate synthase/GTP cyclohydrolase II